jgi:hypothetical protein
VAKDRAVSIDGRLYEAPTMLIGEYIQLLYHQEQPDRVQIFHKGNSYGFLLPVDLRINCKVKREKDGDRLLVPEPQPARLLQGRLPFAAGEAKS